MPEHCFRAILQDRPSCARERPAGSALTGSVAGLRNGCEDDVDGSRVRRQRHDAILLLESAGRAGLSVRPGRPMLPTSGRLSLGVQARGIPTFKRGVGGGTFRHTLVSTRDRSSAHGPRLRGSGGIHGMLEFSSRLLRCEVFRRALEGGAVRHARPFGLGLKYPHTW
jgi:hypothetical protein